MPLGPLAAWAARDARWRSLVLMTVDDLPQMILQYFFWLQWFSQDFLEVASLSHLPPAMGQRGSHQEVKWWNLQLKSTVVLEMNDERSETMRNLQRKCKCFDTFPGGDHGSFMRQAQQAQCDWAVDVYKGLTALSDFHRFKRAIRAVSLRTRARWRHGTKFPAVSGG